MKHQIGCVIRQKALGGPQGRPLQFRLGSSIAISSSP